VDDNLNFIKRMISILDDVKYPKKISVASDYHSALQQLSVCRQHILLLDINMPGKSGIELLRFIREQMADMEVIMLTNHSEVFYREQCKELGARFFLDKSNDFLQVPDIVNAYCQRNIETS
jgi:DNA-binding NarL/FixJ family response regulator